MAVLGGAGSCDPILVVYLDSWEMTQMSTPDGGPPTGTSARASAVQVEDPEGPLPTPLVPLGPTLTLPLPSSGPTPTPPLALGPTPTLGSLRRLEPVG